VVAAVPVLPSEHHRLRWVCLPPVPRAPTPPRGNRRLRKRGRGPGRRGRPRGPPYRCRKGFVEGHDLSRAVTAATRPRASAPEAVSYPALEPRLREQPIAARHRQEKACLPHQQGRGSATSPRGNQKGPLPLRRPGIERPAKMNLAVRLMCRKRHLSSAKSRSLEIAQRGTACSSLHSAYAVAARAWGLVVGLL
jgi:hypothetical protein